ncbi:hypothetical protein ABPG74_012769 [Tetrahymena malaccensis]
MTVVCKISYKSQVQIFIIAFLNKFYKKYYFIINLSAKKLTLKFYELIKAIIKAIQKTIQKIMQQQTIKNFSQNNQNTIFQGIFSCCSIPNIQTCSFSTDKQPQQEFLALNPYTKNWISLIHDSNFVSTLNIPGTHQTMALIGGPGVTLAQCQTWNLQSQLECGIRYLDIRIKRTKDNSMPIYHGIVFQNSYFQRDVFPVVQKFLLENPNEFIIMNVKSEGKPEAGALNLEDILQPFINQHQDLFFQTTGGIPQVKDLRGKVWILPYYNWKLNGFSLEKLKLEDILHHQDAFEVNLMDKKHQIIEHYVKAFFNKDLRSQGKKLFINNINAVKWYKWPSEFAKALNQFVYDKKYFEGIVALDFPGESLVKEIIKSNFPENYFKLIEN